MSADKCALCSTSTCVVWRFLMLGTGARVCNRCYLDRHPRIRVTSESAAEAWAKLEVQAGATAQSAVEAQDQAPVPVHVDFGASDQNAIKLPQLEELSAGGDIKATSLVCSNLDFGQDDVARATETDHAAIDDVVEKFKLWLINKHGMAEISAHQCGRMVLISFRTHSKAMSCMATEQYKLWVRDNGIKGSISGCVAALGWFGRYWREEHKQKLWSQNEGSALALQQNARKRARQKSEHNTLDARSDTEYPEANLERFPSKMKVEGCGMDNIDGIYIRMPQAHRGRASYELENGQKETFFYWRDETWQIGHVLGSSKTVAKLQDHALCQDPVELYPHSWKVYQKEGGEWVTNVGMRIIDVIGASQVAVEEFLPSQPDKPGAALGSPHRLKKSKVEKSEEGVLKLEKAAERAGVEADTPAKPGGEAGADRRDVQQADASSSSESDSDSNSDSSSSESGASSATAPSPKLPASPAAAVPSGAVTLAGVASAVANPTNPKKVAEFEEKSRLMLKSCKDAAERQKKLGMFMLQAKQYMLISTLSREGLVAFKEKLEREFADADDAAPTRGLLTVPLVGLPTAPQGSEAMPVTPPDRPGGALPTGEGREAMPHRRPGTQPVRSAMRRPGGPRGVRRVQMCDAVADPSPLANEEVIASFRGYFDTLWFVQPGAVVSCDRCSADVSQNLGSLRGAAGRSQFAQDQFFCATCLSQ